MRHNIACVCLLILVYLNLEGIVADSRIDPLVDTKVGLIRGVRATDGDYSMFMGIPFGKVDPNNPFGPSTAYPTFDEVFEANDDSAICPQLETITNTITGTIDCLHLNIYVPSSATSRNRLPVLVWIYGGGFVFGSAGRTLYGPKYLVRHDVILVTLNYRVGPYGFMCLDIPEAPGNQGLKDQLLALRWINENIEAFGGDASRITIFGESAGGKSVDLHLYSEQEKLFQKVILQSGTALLPSLYGENNSNELFQLAEILGLTTSDVRQALNFISTIEPELVIAAALRAGNFFFPCVEKDFDNVEKFLVDYPVNSDIPKAKGMSMLIGFNAEERLGDHLDKDEEFYNNWNGFHYILSSGFSFDEEDLNQMEDIIRHFYIGDENISSEVKFDLAEFESDYVFNYPTQRTIAKYLNNGAEEIFQYLFTYVGNRNLMRRINNFTEGGAIHADELGYLFDISFWRETPTPEDQQVIDAMTTMWTNFAKFGDPTPTQTDLLPIKWEAITRDSPNYYLDINYNLKMGKSPFYDRMAFWELFYVRNEKYQQGYREN